MSVIAALGLATALFVGTAKGTPAARGTAEIVPLDRGFEVRTARLEVRVLDGSIVRLVNRRTGEVHADRVGQGIAMPAGLGTIGRDAAAMRSLLSPWSTRPAVVERSEREAFPSQRAPDGNWSMSLETHEGTVSAIWRTPANDPSPAELAIVARVGEGGDTIDFTAEGRCEGGGIYGVALPIRELSAKHAAYVSSFGGVRMPATKLDGVTSLGTAPFAEAPAIAIEGERGSVGFWLVADEMPPYFLFTGGNRRTMSVAIAALETMPYEPRKSSRRNTWRLGVTEGDWRAALQPYRDWYAAKFATDIASREGAGWARNIQVILDEWDGSRATFASIASRLPPETVLIHEWNARGLPFGEALPDWTPGARYLAMVRLAHEFGFRAMGYVNTYCINYATPVFERDGIRGFGLTRPYPGPWGYGLARETFDSAKPGQMLYLDPLSSRWREYHVSQMKQWITATGSDALYEDVGGTAGDFGNGRVEGLEGAQGGTAQFRELQTQLTRVPLATEFAPEHMAFASSWPLRYQQVWGSQAVRDDWLWTQRPVARFLHGGRSWTPTVNAFTERDRMLVVSSSDALGGVSQFPARESELQATAGMCGHMLERAEIFAKRRLTPTDRPMPLGSGVTCEYTASDGETFVYRAEFPKQELLDGSGSPVYQRVFGATSVESRLRVPGWPGLSGDSTIGLNPASPYALSRSPGRPTGLRVLGLPGGTFIERYVESDDAVVLTIDSPSRQLGENRSMVVSVEGEATSAWSGGTRVDGARKSGSMTIEVSRLPASLVVFRKQAPVTGIGESLGAVLEPGRFIAASAGIERGGRYLPPKRQVWQVADRADPTAFMFLNGGMDSEIQFDFSAEVPAGNASAEVLFRSTSMQFGNGSRARVLVDGIEMGAALAGTEAADRDRLPKFRTDVFRILIPLGRRAGSPVVISVVGDGRGNDNADELWFARPRFVADKEQRLKIESLGRAKDLP